MITCVSAYGDFYQNLSFAAFEAAVAPYCAGKRTVLYGSSLGGYCAIYYAGAVNGTALAVTPRLSIHRDFINQSRTHKNLLKINSDARFLHQDLVDLPRGKGFYMIYDPKNAEDMKFKKLIFDNSLPNKLLYSYFFENGGHGQIMLPALLRSKKFNDILQAVVDDDRATLQGIFDALQPNEFNHLNVIRRDIVSIKRQLRKIEDPAVLGKRYQKLVEDMQAALADIRP